MQRGYVAIRITDARLDAASHTLVLTVVPGRIADIRVVSESAPMARVWPAFGPRRGDLLNLRDLEQGLENLKRLPTASARIRILPASGSQARAGESDLEIIREQGRHFRVAASLDDAGLTATGRLQVSATVSWDNPAGLSDLFYASYGQDVFNASGRGSRNAAAHYSVPFGGWLIGATAGRYEYHQTVQDNLRRYRDGTEGGSAELRATSLLHRDVAGKTQGYVAVWWRGSDSYLEDTAIGVQRRRMGGWEVGLNHRRYLGQGVVDATLA